MKSGGISFWKCWWLIISLVIGLGHGDPSGFCWDFHPLLVPEMAWHAGAKPREAFSFMAGGKPPVILYCGKLEQLDHFLFIAC